MSSRLVFSDATFNEPPAITEEVVIADVHTPWMLTEFYMEKLKEAGVPAPCPIVAQLAPAVHLLKKFDEDKCREMVVRLVAKSFQRGGWVSLTWLAKRHGYTPKRGKRKSVRRSKKAESS